MLAYIIRRLLWVPVVLVVISMVTYALAIYGPGDPVQVLMGFRANPEVVERIRRERGLDKPFFEQYLNYVTGIVTRGDFGVSYKFLDQKVTDILIPKVFVSVQLGLVATILIFGIGIPLGVIAAVKQGTWFDTLIVGITIFGVSLPIFLTAPILIIFFVRTLHLLPTSGWGGIFDARIIMPAIVMSLGGIGVLTRLMRASTLDVIAQDFVRTARAKGLREWIVLSRHVVRNALLPIVTVLGLSLASLVEGTFITETFFGIPGVGQFAVDSFFARDYPSIMAITLMIATVYIAANLVIDIIYTFIDPRIRYT